MYWLNTGIVWRDLPERFGALNTVYARFSRWSKQGVWDRVFQALLSSGIVDESSLMLDSTIVRVHQHGNAPKKEEVGKSKGGLTTKVHALCDGLGNPLHFLFTGGNVHDVKVAKDLLACFDLNQRKVLCDKGYDSSDLVEYI